MEHKLKATGGEAVTINDYYKGELEPENGAHRPYTICF